MPTLLETMLPTYDFHEVHRRWIPAAGERVWDALTGLTLDELTITKLLVAVRHLGRSTPTARPLFSDGPMTMLHATPPTYALGGAIGRPWKFSPQRRPLASLEDFANFDEPGWTKYLTDFHLQPRDGGILLTTETRGRSTNAYARRRFGAYWILIRPGSGIVRHDMLATIARIATT